MRYRSLGTTGVKVSPLCLGAMMFGAMGNPDHDDCIRIIHRALDAGINFVDTADVYSAGESEEIVGKALAGRRDDIVLATKLHAPMGQDPNEQGNSRRWIVREVENSLRRLRHRPHRPLPGAPSRAGYRCRRHALRALGPRASRQGALPRIVDVPGRGDRRGAVDGRAARPRTVPRRAAAVLDLRARHRGGRSPDLRAVRHGRDPVEPAQRRLPDRSLPARRRRAEGRPRGADAGPLRSRASGRAAQARAHSRAGEGRGRRRACRSPTWRSASRSRTRPSARQSSGRARWSNSTGCSTPMSRSTTRRSIAIDALVPPGTNVNRGESGWAHPALSQAWRRRRPIGSR